MTKVWLASYPRSGNTFLRIVLNYVFEYESTTLYQSEVDAFDVPGEYRKVGSIVSDYKKKKVEKNELDVKRQNYVFVKSHEMPVDYAPCIYIVRDPRCVIASYRKWISAFSKRDARYEDLIAGREWPGSWSTHFSAWDPHNRPNTLMLRYEDLRDDNSVCCQKIAEFLKIKAYREFDIKFSELQEKNPDFFRSANDVESLAEMKPFEELFTRHHGRVMQDLGYVRDITIAGLTSGGETSTATPPELGVARLAREKDLSVGVIADREADLNQERAHLTEVRNELSHLVLDRDILRNAVSHREMDLHAARQEVQSLRERLAHATLDVNLLRERLNSVDAEAADMRRTVVALQEEKAHLLLDRDRILDTLVVRNG